MKALLVYPVFPTSYWGQEYTRTLTGKQAVLPPLGLVTAAALLPRDWELRLVDLNVEELSDAAIEWADVVMISAMRLQRASFHEVVRRAHALGKRVVAGGPYVTTDPDSAPDVDHLVIGEAEGTLPELARALEAGSAARRVQAAARPDVMRSPVPRFDLLRVERYGAIGVQFSRGCPFNCEFCDIIEIFGRTPRTKDPEQLLRELDAVRATGFRGALFVVDDNFIGNKVAARKMLARLAAWSREHGSPFDFFTEASMNLAGDESLMRAMVEAGFSAVFVGIETPSLGALKEAQKRQNVRLDLTEAVEKLTRSGLEVMAGFIVGFDADDESIFEQQRDFIARSPIPLAMVGCLTALPGTQLHRRLAREGRLHDDCVGDNQVRPNFVTRMPETALADGYAWLLRELYSPRAYFNRALRTIELQRSAPRTRHRRSVRDVAIAWRSLWQQGVRSSYRAEYWRFLAKAFFTAPRRWTRAFALAVVGEHMIRYTAEDVLPRLAVSKLDAAREAKGRRAAERVAVVPPRAA